MFCCTKKKKEQGEAKRDYKHYRLSEVLLISGVVKNREVDVIAAPYIKDTW